MVGAIVHPADVPDRDGAPQLLKVLRSAFPWLRHVFADSAYAGGKLEGALAKLGKWTIEVVKRSDAARGFVLLPRRWVVVAACNHPTAGAQSSAILAHAQ